MGRRHGGRIGGYAVTWVPYLLAGLAAALLLAIGAIIAGEIREERRWKASPEYRRHLNRVDAMAAAILTPDAGLDTSVAAACGCHLCLTAVARDIARARTGRLYLTDRAVNAALLAMTPDLSDVPGWDHLAGLYLIPGDDRG